MSARKSPEARAATRLNARLQYRYSISGPEFDQMVENQGGRCAACGREDKRLAVDHDHVNGRVRGLVCWGCNIGLGALESPFRPGWEKYLERTA